MKPSSFTQRTAAVAVCVATFLLAACGGEQGSGSANSGGRNGSGVTEPGTRLDLGEAATIEYLTGDGEGRAVVELVAVEQGEPEDLGQFQPSPDDQGKVPYYLRFEIDNQGPVDARSSGITTAIQPIDSAGEVPQRLLLTAPFPSCESTGGTPFPPETTQRTCEVFMVPDGRMLDFVHYQPATGPYRDDPIVWQLPR